MFPLKDVRAANAAIPPKMLGTVFPEPMLLEPSVWWVLRLSSEDTWKGSWGHKVLWLMQNVRPSRGGESLVMYFFLTHFFV